MLREAVPIGVIVIWRDKSSPSTDKQIELVTTFADQAVIAIENVRLFQELEARTRELARSVEELQALGEVSQAVSSTLDLETVLTTIVVAAVQLAGADGGTIYEYDEVTQEFPIRATSQDYDRSSSRALRAGAAPAWRGSHRPRRRAAASPCRCPTSSEESPIRAFAATLAPEGLPVASGGAAAARGADHRRLS